MRQFDIVINRILGRVIPPYTSEQVRQTGVELIIAAADYENRKAKDAHDREIKKKGVVAFVKEWLAEYKVLEFRIGPMILDDQHEVYIELAGGHGKTMLFIPKDDLDEVSRMINQRMFNR